MDAWRMARKAADKVFAPLQRRRFENKLRTAFAGHEFGFISSNCVGGRFAKVLNQPYRSPTVGLWFEPRDYLQFVSNLEHHLQSEVTFDEAQSNLRGYPVGILNGVRIHFMHYDTADEAQKKWRERAQRVALYPPLFIFTDRDGASYEDLCRFDALPHRHKLLLTHRPYPELRSAVYVPGYENNGCVGDLYSDWHRLDKALSPFQLKALATPVVHGAPLALALKDASHTDLTAIEPNLHA